MFIEGPEENIDAFESFISKGEQAIDFNQFIPYPAKFKRLDDEAKSVVEKLEKEAGDARLIDWSKVPKDGYNQGGYDWCITNWGTKWNASEPTVQRTSIGTMSAWFDTAWSPPLGVLQAMSVMFPALSFTLKYEEGGMGFAGNSTYKNGIEVEADQWDYTDEEEEEEGLFGNG